MADEQQRAPEFSSSRRTLISSEKVRLNGIDILKLDVVFIIEQPCYLAEISKLTIRGQISFEAFRSIRAKLVYAAL